MLAAALAVGAVAGCGDGADAPVPTPDANAYAAALAPFMPVADPEEQPNVFVAPFEETLALEEQVAIIELIGEGYDLKFVDDPATAVDADAVGRPVLDDGLLIVLGTIPADTAIRRASRGVPPPGRRVGATRDAGVAHRPLGRRLRRARPARSSHHRRVRR